MIYDIAIVGAGVAGCSAAYHARQRGFSAIIIEAGAGVAAAASGNPVGLIKPVLDINDSLFFQFHQLAFAYFLKLWPQLNVPPLFHGIVQLPVNAAESLRAQRRVAATHLPNGWAIWENAAQLGQRLGTVCNGDGIWLPQALAINPHTYCQALVGNTPLITQTRIRAWQHIGNHHVIIHAIGVREKNEVIEARNIIICAGVKALGISALQHLPIRPKRGQLTYLPADIGFHLQQPVTFGHYLTPVINGQTMLGATYAPCAWDANTNLCADEQQRNLTAYAALQSLLPELPDISATQLSGRAAIRATTPQSLPLFGAITDQPNAYYLTGLGSRGLMTAPYTAKVLVDMIMA